MRYISMLETTAGTIWLQEEDGALAALRLPGEAAPSGEMLETPLLRAAARQITEYFEGRRGAFELKLAPKGTQFQRAVWAALQAIPAGETRSYGEIARAVGKPGASRAVGAANHRNPLPIVIPCHRVIGANGRLVGYGGGLPLKERLLQLEAQFYRGQGKS